MPLVINESIPREVAAMTAVCAASTASVPPVMKSMVVLLLAMGNYW